ncbi:MAG: ATP-binding protein [Bacilli bacterium]|nr:ATP-binding protein [Bacilli bacterium]
MKRKFWNKLKEWQEKNIEMPLMVVGARQVGKTYIIDKFCRGNFDDYVYINLKDEPDIIDFFKESIPTVDKVKKLELKLNRSIKVNTVIFFDEIQESEELISALKYFCDSSFPYKIVCAGSLLGVKLKRFNSSFPVGKVNILHMYPMDFEEFLLGIGEELAIGEIKRCFNEDAKIDNFLHRKLLEFYRLYLCVGGMPKSIMNLRDNGLNILDYDSNIVKSIIEAYLADMKRYTLSYFETVKIEKIYKNMPSQLAKENKKFQYSKIEKNARSRDYESALDWLLASNLVLKCNLVDRLESPLKGFMNENSFKLYFSDVSILTSMLEMSYNKILLDENMMYKGVIAENYVANELVKNGFSLYYWAVNQVAEIDFLIDTDDGVIPIEVKANDNTTSKSLNYYVSKYKPNYSIRISTKNFGFENGIKSVPLYAVFCIEKN